MEVEKLLVKVATAADMLSVNKLEIRRLTRLGFLRTVGSGKGLRVATSSIRAFQSLSKGDLPTGYIYFARFGRYCKIGQSKDVHRRMSDLNTSFPEDIQLIHTIPTNNMTKAETQFHRQFSDRRVRGEWFELSDEDIATVCRCQALLF